MIDKTSDCGKIEEILRKKLIPWEPENEFRFLGKDIDSHYKIGEISAVYFGSPFRHASNRDVIVKSSEKLRDYDRYEKQLLEIATEEKIPCYSIKIDGAKVSRDSRLGR